MDNSEQIKEAQRTIKEIKKSLKILNQLDQRTYSDDGRKTAYCRAEVEHQQDLVRELEKILHDIHTNI